MTAKEYLSQARFINQRIKSKVQRVEVLNDLATSATATLSGMPHNPSPATSRMADVICKIVDLQAEINADAKALVDLQYEIQTTIKAVTDVELQTVLEKRYLCMLSWEQIAVDMGYTIHHLYKIHNNALEKVDAILKDDT